jgi:hypothetical protein
MCKACTVQAYYFQHEFVPHASIMVMNRSKIYQSGWNNTIFLKYSYGKGRDVSPNPQIYCFLIGSEFLRDVIHASRVFDSFAEIVGSLTWNIFGLSTEFQIMCLSLPTVSPVNLPWCYSLSLCEMSHTMNLQSASIRLRFVSFRVDFWRGRRDCFSAEAKLIQMN